MIHIHLYGKLRRYADDKNPGCDSILHLDAIENETLQMLLKRTRLDIEEIFTIFLNSKLLTTHNRMAQWLEYPQVSENCHGWDLSIVVKDGDRIGLFGRDMPALVV
jgi:hypothetical protein